MGLNDGLKAEVKPPTVDTQANPTVQTDPQGAPPAQPEVQTNPPEGDVNPVDKKNEIRDEKEVIKDATSRIRSFFSDKELNLGTDRAENAGTDILGSLTASLGEIQIAWSQQLKNAKTPQEVATLFAEYNPKVEETVQLAKDYLDAMTKVTKWSTPEALVRMESDINKRASNFQSLIMQPDNKDILKALKWAISSVETDKISGLKDAFEVLKNRIPAEYPKGDDGLMPCLWMIMGFMTEKERAELVKDYLKKDPNLDLEKFLETGNSRGIFTVKEMEELQGISYTEEKRKIFTEIWKMQNDHRKEATQLTMTSYGTKNAANEMLTLGNIGMTFLQFVAGTTIVGNIATDIFQGGKFKSIDGVLAAIRKPHNLIAGGVIAAINIYKKNLTPKEVLASKGTNETIKEQTAYQKFDFIMNGDTSWGEWDGFLKGRDCAGIKVLWDYIQFKKKLNNGVIDENLSSIFNGGDFMAHLDGLSRDPEADKKINYAELKKSFQNIKSTKNMLLIGEIFDSLNIGGAMTLAEYEEKKKKAPEYAA